MQRRERNPLPVTSNPILILSGGLDSTVLLWALKPAVTCLTFNYGQRHMKEINSAAYLASEANCRWNLADLSEIGPLISKGAVAGFDPLPEGHYSSENMASTIVPNRNMIMLSIAVGHAIATGAIAVYYAAHSGDHAIYPDCRQEFVSAFQNACIEGNGFETSPAIYAPFIFITKADIVSQGLSLNVPFEKTWSCYRGEGLACGRCGTCVERLEAFALCDAVDPLPYADREYWKEQVQTRDALTRPNTQNILSNIPPSEREF